MKMFALFLVSLMFLFSCTSSFAESVPENVRLSTHYSLFISYSDNNSSGKGPLFPFDSYSADLYFVEGNKQAYLCTTKCFSGIFITSGMVNVSVAENNGLLYLADSNGNCVTAFYDENGTDLWIYLENVYFRMTPVPSFSVFNDWKSQP